MMFCSCAEDSLTGSVAVRRTFGDNGSVQPSLRADLQRLSKLAYRRLEWSGDAVRDFHRLRKAAGKHPDFHCLEKACAWLFVPFTLWPIDFHSLYQVIQDRIEAGKRLEADLRLLIDSLPPLPDNEAQAVIAAHEHAVQRGDYEAQVMAGEKYRLLEAMLMKNQQFRRAWAAIKAGFDVTEYQDRKGIIRRRVVAERAFRTEWQLNWEEPAARFQAVFDAFCHRWNLYGMEGDQPLLQKLTVNLTPHGTMVFIPSWWSLDPKRDLNWGEIKKLHNARVASKQGAKLTRNQIEQTAEAEKAALLDADARARGLKGDQRTNWVMEQLKWTNKDARKLRLVLSRGKRVAINP